MTRLDFIDSYCKRSRVSWDELSKRQIVLLCECKQEFCQGWAMVNNDLYSIKRHIDLYAPSLRPRYEKSQKNERRKIMNAKLNFKAGVPYCEWKNIP
jgi:hypothetical protein